ncbi:amiloride-sensitive sodium channel subunit beta-like isoform X3 [Lineus longissimus]|uniref:amiloride-sensitive sodium channel subunit beta-like isoform X3 n=1 Tax=Lineus longissimus TaxID=88925 RepID=UPI00315D3568
MEHGNTFSSLLGTYVSDNVKMNLARSQAYFCVAEMVEQEEVTYRSLIKDWAVRSSCHGIPHAGSASTPLRRVFWTVCFLICGAIFVWQGGKFLQRFLKYEVAISIDYTTASTVDFPAVTICNANIIRKSNISDGGPDLVNLLKYSAGLTNDTPHADAKTRHAFWMNFSKVWARIDSSHRISMGHDLNVMLLGCHFAGHECHTGHFKIVNNPVFGNCYVYNSGWNGSRVAKAHGEGIFHSLALELFIEQHEYVPELVEAAGVRVNIGTQNIMPFPEDNGIFAQPGTLTSIGLRRVELVRLQHPYPSKCVNYSRQEGMEHSIFSEIHDVKYTVPACEKTCYQRNMIERCHCADPFYPHTYGEAFKAVWPKNTEHEVKSCISEEEIECEERIQKMFIEDQLGNCDCPQSCYDTDFQMTVSSFEWPAVRYRDVYYKEIASYSDELYEIVYGTHHAGTTDENLLKLEIFFNELNFEKIQQNPDYSGNDLFADIGGTVGLWIGLSILAVFEGIELLVDLTSLYFKRRNIIQTARNSDSNTSNNKTNQLSPQYSTEKTFTASLGSYPGLDLAPVDEEYHDLSLAGTLRRTSLKTFKR